MFTVSTSLLLNQVKPQLRPCNKLQQPTQAGMDKRKLVPYFYWEWTIGNKPRKRTTDRDCVTTKEKENKGTASHQRPRWWIAKTAAATGRQYPRLTRKNHSKATALLRLQNEQRFLWPRWRWTIRNQSKQPSNDTIARKKQKSESTHNTPQNSPAATTVQIEGTVPTMMSLLAG